MPLNLSWGLASGASTKMGGGSPVGRVPFGDEEVSRNIPASYSPIPKTRELVKDMRR